MDDQHFLAPARYPRLASVALMTLGAILALALVAWGPIRLHAHPYDPTVQQDQTPQTRQRRRGR